MLSIVEIKEESDVPVHQHPHKQAGILLIGQMELTIGEDKRLIQPGEMYIIPPNTPHAVTTTGGPVTALNIFSPIMEDYVASRNQYIRE